MGYGMEKTRTVIEFYFENEPKFLKRVTSYAVPRQGEYVDLDGVVWLVRQVTWAVDYYGRPDETLRANVVLAKQENGSNDH